MRCIPNIQPFLSPLEEIIHCRLLPNLTGQPSFSDSEQNMFALPARLGGLGVVNPISYSLFQFGAFVKVTAPLIHLILQQSCAYPVEVLSSQIEARRTILGNHHQSIIDFHDALLSMLSPSLYRSIMLSSEKGSSNWVTVLPLTEHDFCLHKGAFRDVSCLQYNW